MQATITQPSAGFDRDRTSPMTLAFVVLAALALAGSACGIANGTRGSGTALVETLDLDLSGVRFIEVNDAWDAEVREGAPASVEITIDDNLRDHVEIKTNGDTITIDSEGSFRPRIGFNVVVTLPDVDGIKVTDASEVVADGLDTADFEVGDASDLTVTNSRADEVRIDAGDAATVTVTGTATKVSVDVNDASTVDLSDLEVEEATVDASDASEVEVRATNTVRGSADDASDIIVLGGAAIDVSTSDGSSVQRG